MVTPEYGEIVPVTDEGEGPMEYGCDAVCVDAKGRVQAKVIAVREMRRRGMEYINDNPDRSPFTGLEVRSAICEHGFCMCDCDRSDGDVCDICLANWRREDLNAS